jgi:2-keto-4-pentenoate hydratase/2-oxohepta-3-ene-1,7-dioic acid hydratase in catechol pathway
MGGYSIRLLTFRTRDDERAGVVWNGGVFDASELTGRSDYRTMQGILDDWSQAETRLTEALGTSDGEGSRLSDVDLLSPVPNPRAIYCAGANYQDHIDQISLKHGVPPEPNPHELGLAPFIFLKTSHCVIGTGAEVAADAMELDYEAELAAVIGKKAFNVAVDDALSIVAGYTIANDMSARDRMLRRDVKVGSPFRYDWSGHKIFDGSCPVGPFLIPASDSLDPQNLRLRTWVNDRLVQDSNTSNMIYSLAEIISHISSRVTLHPGDLVLTGTPAGVGAETGEFLKAGDSIRIQIQGLGELETRITTARNLENRLRGFESAIPIKLQN